MPQQQREGSTAMPDARRHLATGLAYGSTSPLDALRRNYRRREPPVQLSPGEIVAGLHAEIAAMSPGQADLVARFERKQQRRGSS